LEKAKSIRWPRLLISIVVCLGAGGLGSIPTAKALKEWYPSLEKPSFNPPNAIFGPVWTLLYILMGVAAYLVSERGDEEASAELIRRAESLFAVQLGLNTVWSVLFFGLRSPLAALIELAALWIAIVMTIRSFAKVSRPAALLLAPYLAWTTFAAALNASIWWLNRDNPSAA